MGIKKTQKEFIEQAKEIHKDFYDYSFCHYVNCKTKIKIICPLHGEFEQRAQHHIDGHGCQKCFYDKIKSEKEKTAVQRLIEKHRNTYDYSLVEYKGVEEKIKIICPIHGVFEQNYSNHLSGNRCGKCFPRKKKTTEKFIEEAKKIHGDRFDYSLVEYVKNDVKVKIMCRKHGIFEQNPKEHLSGQACKACHCEIVNTGFNEFYHFTPYLKSVCDKFSPQYPVIRKGKTFYVDFYFPHLNLVIEYDEKQHQYKIEEDKRRQKIIEKILGCEFIRIDDATFMSDNHYYDDLLRQKLC